MIIIILIAAGFLLGLILLVSSDDAVSQANTTQESLYDRGRRHYRAGEMDKAERNFIEHLKHDLSHS